VHALAGTRFAIPLVVEHYGSTEMPGDAVLNYFMVPGACGYVPRAVWADREAKLVRFDTVAESVVRDAVRDALTQHHTQASTLTHMYA
jgi:hypothetical protein